MDQLYTTCPPCHGNCQQGRKCPTRPQPPATGQHRRGGLLYRFWQWISRGVA